MPVTAICTPASLQRLALGGGLGCLTSLDEATGEGPLSVARFDGALYQEYPVVELDDRPGDQLRPEIEHEAALLAHQTLRITLLDHAVFQPAAAKGTEFVVWAFHCGESATSGVLEYLFTRT